MSRSREGGDPNITGTATGYAAVESVVEECDTMSYIHFESYRLYRYRHQVLFGTVGVLGVFSTVCMASRALWESPEHRVMLDFVVAGCTALNVALVKMLDEYSWKAVSEKHHETSEEYADLARDVRLGASQEGLGAKVEAIGDAAPSIPPRVIEGLGKEYPLPPRLGGHAVLAMKCRRQREKLSFGKSMETRPVEGDSPSLEGGGTGV